MSTAGTAADAGVPPTSTCPTCGGDGVPIVMGPPPGAALMAAGDAGRVRFGGCVIWPGEEQANWAGTRCPHRWFDADDARWEAAVDTAVSEAERSSRQAR